MPYTLLAGAVALVVVSVSVVRLFLKSGRAEPVDFVTQNVLTRIKAEYRDLH